MPLPTREPRVPPEAMRCGATGRMLARQGGLEAGTG
jgi:hypothetical protein